MQSIILLLDTVLSLYTYVIIAMIIMSWLLTFGIVNINNQFVRQLQQVIFRLTEPVLGPIRRVLPDLGGIDLSPIVVLLGIFFVRNLLVEYGPRLAG